MSNDKDIANELDAIQVDEQPVDTDASVVDDASDESVKADSVSIEENDLEKDEKADEKDLQREKVAQGLENSWFTKVEQGKVELDEVPKWLRPRVEKRLGLSEKEPDVESLVKKTFKEMEDEQKFKKLMSELPVVSSEQKAELKRLYAKYRALGKYEALETASQLLGLDSKSRKAQERVNQRNAMLIRPGGQSTKKSKQGVNAIARDNAKWQELIKNPRA